jgi:hypothetical protein
MQRTDSTMGGPETECIQRSATSGKLTGQHKQLLATPPLPILATHLNILRDSDLFFFWGGGGSNDTLLYNLQFIYSWLSLFRYTSTVLGTL